ncbi:MAG TPA: aminopeptidase N [Chromatiales bacterium]|nr:aminopeptidase N [Thiotrichales bacterium]HIP68825.1 aminopeptidase N [Chromatiales bacterium]
MKEASPRTIYLKDYRPPAFLLESVNLYFNLLDKVTEVRASLNFYRNPDCSEHPADLKLDGEKLELISIGLDGKTLSKNAYQQDNESLTVFNVPDKFTLETRVRIYPGKNTELEGLYLSSGNYCTQCEAQGFRKITFYPDRPDVMAVFSVTIEAEKSSFPVLLANGNPLEKGEVESGRHWVKWHDPFPKPAYLFALVAGDLTCTSDEFITRSSRKIDLQIYTEAHNADKTAHAMRSLKRAMLWDEERFGLEYDLDIYMIVAVDDFNMGAMENKGLNVFNSKYILARQDTATDADYVAIEGVIAHEYFHNWTGNRVTCRDWFQLSLKEGLTVFRDQEFTADMTSASVKRIDDVRSLRTYQFAEDASPMAHPVRPDSFIEINNFYTLTVYEKGAEVVRMYQSLLGRDGFRKGMDLYFKRHDGQAVTTEDFLAAMSDANNVDLSQFQNWYEQAGTPELKITDGWDEKKSSYTVNIEQRIPGDEQAKPLLIPLEIGLLDEQGNDMPLKEINGKLYGSVLKLSKPVETFVFTALSEHPVPSFLRGFSAPVKLRYDYSDAQLAFLMAHDNDDFNRWDAGQDLATKVLLKIIKRIQQGKDLSPSPYLLDAYTRLLEDQSADPALLAEALTLPSEVYLAEQMNVIDVDAIHQAREFLRVILAKNLQQHWLNVYKNNQTDGVYSVDAESMGRRGLKNVALAYLLTLNNQGLRDLARRQFSDADNMTDTMSAMRALVMANCPEGEVVLQDFHERWQADSLVMDKWFALQASVPHEATLSRIKKLMEHPLFSLTNPNKVRAVIGSFTSLNPVCFHAADGSGYRFVAEQLIKLDALNPQISARLAKSFSRWRKYDEQRQALMTAQLEKILAQPKISKDVYEVVKKSLKG